MALKFAPMAVLGGLTSVTVGEILSSPGGGVGVGTGVGVGAVVGTGVGVGEVEMGFEFGVGVGADFPSAPSLGCVAAPGAHADSCKLTTNTPTHSKKY